MGLWTKMCSVQCTVCFRVKCKMQFQERQRPWDAKHFFHFSANSGLIEFVLICDTALRKGIQHHKNEREVTNCDIELSGHKKSEGEPLSLFDGAATQ